MFTYFLLSPVSLLWLALGALRVIRTTGLHLEFHGSVTCLLVVWVLLLILVVISRRLIFTRNIWHSESVLHRPIVGLLLTLIVWFQI